MKHDACLKVLEESIPGYIRKVGRFQFENEKFEISKHYFASEYQRCQVCGHYPIREVFEITCNDRTLKVGNECIDKITNQKISKWFRDHHRRRECIEKHAELIDSVDYLLSRYGEGALRRYGISISSQGIERLQKMLDRMCEGYNPTQKQIDLYAYYRRKIVRAVEGE